MLCQKDMLATKKPRPQSYRGIFVGYEVRQQVGHRIYLPEFKSFTVRFHVGFRTADNVFKGVQGKAPTDDQIETIIETITHQTPTISITSQ